MTVETRLTSVETVREEGSWLFTIRDRHGERDEAILVPCGDDDDASAADADDADVDAGADERRASDSPGGGVEAWINRCTHEAQRLDRGFGAAVRDDAVVCPKHGSMFDACSGYCDNGEAAGTTLVSVDVAVRDGDVFLVDDDARFLHAGGVDDGDDGPASTSHIGF